MRVTVNGEARELPAGQTLSDLLGTLKLEAGRLACEINGNLVRRADYGAAVLKDNDAVEVVQMIGGG